MNSSIDYQQFDLRLLDISPTGMTILNMNGEITYANKAAERILGLSANLISVRLYNAPDWKITDFSGNPILDEHLPFSVVVRDKKAVLNFEHAIEHVDGTKVYLSINASPIFNSDEQLEGVFASIEEITYRVLKEKELISAKEIAEQNEQRYKGLLKNLETGVIIHAADTSIISCNVRSQELLGLTEDQLKGKVAIDPYWKFIFEDGTDIPLEDYPVMKVIRTKTILRNQVVGVTKPNNEITWVLVNGLPVLSETDEIKEVIISFIDITERKLAEDALVIAKDKAEESERRLSLATGSANLGIWEWDIENQKMIWDDRTYELFGYDRDANRSTDEIWNDAIHSEDQDLVLEAIDQAINGNGVYSAIFRVVHPDGKILYISGNGFVLRDSDGEPTRMIGINRDVTISRIQEIALKASKLESEKREFELTESQKIAKIGSWYLDLATNEVVWTEELYHMYGFDPAQPLPNYSDFEHLYTPDSWSILSKKVENTIKTGEPYELELELVRKDGSVGWIWAKGVPVLNDTNDIIALRGIAQDILERKRLDKQLIEAKDKAERVVAELNESQKVAKIGSWYLDLATNDVVWTEELYNMYGFDSSKPPPNFTEFSHLYAPESWAILSKAVEEAIINGTPYEFELETVKDDGSPGWMWAKGEAVKNEKNEVFALRGVAQDITDRKLMDKQLIRSKNEAERVIVELNESQKVAKIGSWHLDVLTNEVTWSQELYDMYGFDSSVPPPPYTEHMKLFTPESWNLLSENLALTSQEGIPYELELQTIRIDKSNGWMWVKGEAIKNDNDEIVALRGVAQDITERKESEETIRKSLLEKEVLLAEVHHRVKNNLALISAMLYLQQKEFNNNDFSELILDTQSRIQSIASVHELLYQNESFIDIRVDQYIEKIHDQLKRIYISDPERITFDIQLEPIVLVIAEAIPLALIINEVLTNTFKHAFDDDSKGKIEILLRNHRKSVVLEINDNGKGLPADFDVENSDSLGFTLIKQFTNQLEGTYEFKCPPKGGTSFYLSFDKEVM